MKNIKILIMAAGLSRRMEGTDKLLLPLGESTVLEQSLRLFLEDEMVEEILIVSDQPEVIERMKRYPKVRRCIPGGAERQDSVYQGLQALEDEDYVLIHDGARPFLSEQAYARAKHMALQNKCFLLAVPVTDTIKRVQEERVVETPKRSELFAAQTPQGFPVHILRRAYDTIRKEGLTVTDDAQAVEYIGEPVYIVAGDYANRKITTKEDLIYL